MGKINTVKGQIYSEQLGVTYPHEHLITHPQKFVIDEDKDLRLDDVDKAIKELEYFELAGGNAIVDMTTIDYGRDIESIVEISSHVNIHIIVPTGFLKGLYHEPFVRDKSINQLADVMIQEVTEGIEGTNIKAGVIKAGSGYQNISAVEEKVLKAVAIAQSVTGAVISTHTQAGTMGLEQIDILRAMGANPDRIIIGHLDRNLDWDYHLAIANTGVYIMYDHISKEHYFPDKQRIDYIKRLIQGGFGKKILISGDFGRKSYWTSWNGGPGFTYILWRFIPWLKHEGVNEDQIKDILINNPKTALEII